MSVTNRQKTCGGAVYTYFVHEWTSTGAEVAPLAIAYPFFSLRNAKFPSFQIYFSQAAEISNLRNSYLLTSSAASFTCSFCTIGNSTGLCLSHWRIFLINGSCESTHPL